MRLRFTRRAVENISEIASYLTERNPHAAKRVSAAIDESLRYLTLFPRAGRAQTTEGVRKLVTRKYAYIVYYSVDDNAGEIAILADKHPAQQREHDDA